MKSRILMVLALVAIATACTSKEDLKKMMKENPEIITEAIEANPEKFIDALNNAVKVAQEGQGKNVKTKRRKLLKSLSIIL